MTIINFILLILLNVNSDCYARIPEEHGNIHVRNGWTTYYHVTLQENLDSIKREGLSAQYGGDKGKTGMSVLYHQHRDDNKYIQPSTGNLHVAQTWETVCRYTDHMNKLLGEIDTSKTMPVVLKVDPFKHTLTQDDPHEKEALRSKGKVMPEGIFVLVINKTNTETSEEEGFWLPLLSWNPDLHSPAYPDHDNKTIMLDEDTVRHLLARRIEVYSHQRINKSEAAKELAIDPRTLVKFLEKDMSLRASTIQRIMRKFCDQFSLFTRYDYHHIFT